MLPQWAATSGGWMGQMMENIKDYIGGVAVDDSFGNNFWNNQAPVYSLDPSEREIKYFSKVFSSLGLGLTKFHKKPDHILESILHDHSYKAVFCQYGIYAAKFMNIWRKKDIPLFVHFHGYDLTFDLRRSEDPNQRRFNDEYFENIKELSQRAIFISNSKFTTNRLIEAGIAPDRIKLKYFGIPLPENPHMHENRAGVQILHLGRLVDFKSPDRTIQAFEIARSRGLDGELIVAGDGPLRSMCELIRSRSPYKDSIHLLGNVNSQQAHQLLSEADIFTAHNIEGEITRQSECFGVSVLEAMSYGVPVVGTRHGGVVESVVNGETGFLNEPGDIKAQAESFLELARNPKLRQKMGEASRKRVAEHFSPTKEREALIKIMEI